MGLRLASGQQARAGVGQLVVVIDDDVSAELRDGRWIQEFHRGRAYEAFAAKRVEVKELRRGEGAG